MNVVQLIFATVAVVCFAAHGLGWGPGLGFGLASATVAAVLLPAMG